MEKRSTPSLQITDRFGAQAAFASLRLPDGTEATIPAEHAAAIYVNEQPAFRVVCTPALLPQLALGRLLTEGWIVSADEVEQIAVCAEGAKAQVYLRHPLPTRRAAAQELRQKGLDAQQISAALEEVYAPDEAGGDPELEAAAALVEGRYRGKLAAGRKDLVVAALARRGVAYPVIKEAIRRVEEDG